MTIEPLLQIEHVTKSYGATQALNGLSFSVDPGMFAGVLGPNGAGKTTLFQIATGLFGQDDGNVRLFGMTHDTQGSAIRKRIGVVYQDTAVDLDLTVTANLRFHGRLYGLSGPKLADRIAQVGAQFDLTELLERPVRALSGGQKRKVEIARALLHEPDLLLLDEASAGLDPPSRLALIETIRTLAKDQNVTVLWASHLVDEFEHADTIFVLSSGQLVAQGAAKTLIADTGTDDLVEAFSALTSG